MNDKEILKFVRSEMEKYSYKIIREFQNKMFCKFQIKGIESKSIEVMPFEVKQYGYRNLNNGVDKYFSEEIIFFDNYQNLYKKWELFKRMNKLSAFK